MSHERVAWIQKHAVHATIVALTKEKEKHPFLIFWPSEAPSPTKIQKLTNSFNWHLFSAKEPLDFDGRFGIRHTLSYATLGGSIIS